MEAAVVAASWVAETQAQSPVRADRRAPPPALRARRVRPRGRFQVEAEAPELDTEATYRRIYSCTRS